MRQLAEFSAGFLTLPKKIMDFGATYRKIFE
jgi:hypothetical protein